MSLVNVASTSELAPGKMKAVNINGKSVLVANVNGAYFAIGNKCTHMSCALTNGTLAGEIVQCSCHGSRFNVKTGKAVGGPAVVAEPKYDVRIEKDRLMINVNEDE